jgi:predicted ATPase/class 3 adenylate cyclase
MTDLADLPEGTVTFLFTDLEGSTRLLAAHPDAYRVAVRRHHDLLRGAVEAHGGAVFETVGDAVYAAFRRPTDAVAAALAGQRALHGEPWGAAGPLRARMGVHLGEVEVQGGHYFGAPLYRCARLTATAHGGQVVLSAATAELVRDAVPAGAGLRDLGAHRLKDLQRPEHLFQVVPPGLPGDFPPLRSLDRLPHNLPGQLTGFVGRERELAEVAGLLGAQRLVTLTGPGGVGKTRLALQAAADALEGYPDGVWLAELAPLADPALVPQAVAAAVGVREEPARPLLGTLADALRPKRLLLVLDNCEHLLDASARLADALLRACPRVHLLATSREALGIAGETAWRVPSLPVPEDAASPYPTAAGLAGYAAVRLFAERAAAVRPGFAVTDENAGAVAQVCARLDGIPLALELAAARVRVLPPPQLLGRLEDRFRLLTGGSRTALARHQTLQAAVDWSYDLLAEAARTLFARLAVFAGGFSLEAAEAVCADERIESAEVLDLLTRLVDQSLVVVDEQPDGTARYRLLETLRQYAGERLAAGGAAPVAAARARHAAHFLGLAAAAEGLGADNPSPELAGWLLHPGRLAWFERELENLRAALAWLRAPDRAAEGLRLAVALRQAWALRGFHREGARWLEALLAAAPDAPPALRARALDGAGTLAQWQGDHARARAHHEAGLALWRALGNETGAASALQALGVDLWLAGEDARAAALMEESLALARARGDAAAASRCLRDLALIARARQDYARAAALLTESVAQARAAGHESYVASGLAHLGRVAYLQGHPDRAAALLAEQVAAFRGNAAFSHMWANLLEWLAAVAGAQGRPERAARLFGAAAALRRRTGTARYAPDRPAYERDLAATRGQIAAAAFAARWAEGEAMSLEEAAAYALETTPAMETTPAEA